MLRRKKQTYLAEKWRKRWSWRKISTQATRKHIGFQLVILS